MAGAFVRGLGLAQLRTPLAPLLAVVVLRAATAWSSDVAANRASARVKSELRRALVERAAVPAPGGGIEGRTGDLASLATRASTRSTATTPGTCPNSSWP